MKNKLLRLGKKKILLKGKLDLNFELLYQLHIQRQKQYIMSGGRSVRAVLLIE